MGVSNQIWRRAPYADGRDSSTLHGSYDTPGQAVDALYGIGTGSPDDVVYEVWANITDPEPIASSERFKISITGAYVRMVHEKLNVALDARWRSESAVLAKVSEMMGSKSLGIAQKQIRKMIKFGELEVEHRRKGKVLMIRRAE